ncbi:hypothetical protein [Salisediminibacterium beveridgei]|uniref:VanZ like family protein n=1 Tax=Salisediminibacterium beveridgei TaxID=632773 RepID=A0A1D7QYB5_9BACI|nr:hypothetical protein [Salisediminibacterium beveridgei]AOM84002.1 hypothetical protein BBEV_2664 [Salisediminibacterium beveridgei]
MVVLFYLINQTVIKAWTDHWFIHWYVNDLLAGIWLPALTMALAASFRVHQILMLSGAKILLVVLVAGLFWELIAPLYVTGSVRDPFDILAYVSGGLIYLLIMRRIRIPW